MCSRTALVASRPCAPLSSARRRRRSHGGGAGPTRPPWPRTPSSAAPPAPATRSSSAPTRLRTLRSVVISWAQLRGGHSRGGALTTSSPSPGFPPGPANCSMSRNAKGRFAGTQLTRRHRRRRRRGQVGSPASSRPRAPAGRSPRSSRSSRRRPAPRSRPASAVSVRARARPGIVYGGATSQGQPFVAAARRRAHPGHRPAHRLGRAVRAPGYYRLARPFGSTSPSRPRGPFGDPFPYTVSVAEVKRRFEDALGGRVTKKAAKGKLQVELSKPTPPAHAAGCDRAT